MAHTTPNTVNVEGTVITKYIHIVFPTPQFKGSRAKKAWDNKHVIDLWRDIDLTAIIVPGKKTAPTPAIIFMATPSLRAAAAISFESIAV
jgi:hypothetical protein